MSNHSKIVTELKGLTQSSLIALHNDYCESNQYYDFIKDIDATEYNISHEEMNSMNDTLFIINGLGKTVTFSHADDTESPLDYDDLAKWLDGNDLLEKYDIEIN